MKQHLHICLPVLNEAENLPELISCLRKQSYPDFSLYACVNQPEEWWNDSKLNICEDNAKSLGLLNEIKDFTVSITDKSSKGKGWTGKKKGVGWARKVIMDLAAENAQKNDLIVSIDADTYYPPTYLESLVNIFSESPEIIAHSNPYYHPLTNKKAEDEAILRYELYMRVYAIQMLLINNPYAFSAIGSGMATTAYHYKRLGGLTPKHSGEDFYFIQKMAKSGPLSNYNSVKVYPQSRFSDRVNFGTGPAMIKGDSGDWSSYPFYTPQFFLQIEETFNCFPKLFEKDMDTPMTAFLKQQLKRDDIWSPLRKNFKKKELFIKACTELVDGLRILQFLKDSSSKNKQSDEEDFMQSIQYFSLQFVELESIIKNNDFIKNPLSFDNMKMMRDVLVKIEYDFRKMKALH